MIDLLLGGSPCQGFSFAGKQMNFNDERSKLFFEFVRALQEIKPKYFLFENVKMKKEYQEVISKYLGVEPIEINSALVSAQNRKRLYWTNIQGVTLPKDKGILLKDILLDDAIIPVVHNIYGGFGEKSPRIFPDKSPTIRTAAGGGHIPSVVMGEAWHKWWEQNKQYQLDKKYSSLDADKAITMLARQYASWTGNFVTWKEFIRKLHPIECERLQTLPDNYTDGISNSQRYKCLGNGWTVDVIAHILSFIQEPYLHTVVSLFDGVSCGQVALKRAGKAYNQYYASEIDKYAMKVAMKNYPHTMQLGNVVGINWTSFTGRLNMIQRVS